MNELAPLSYYQIIEASTQPGCPICRLSERLVTTYLDALLYEQVNDPGTRETLRAALGFCNPHSWRLLKLPSGYSLGIAIIYRDLISTVLEGLAHVEYKPTPFLSIRTAQEVFDHERPVAATEDAVCQISPKAECPACAHRNRMEDIALSALLDALDDDRMCAALDASAGLCLVHLRRAFELARKPMAFDALRAFAQKKIAALKAELDEYVRKNDYRFRDEGFGPEGDSWIRAIAQMVGAEGVR